MSAIVATRAAVSAGSRNVARGTPTGRHTRTGWASGSSSGSGGPAMIARQLRSASVVAGPDAPTDGVLAPDRPRSAASTPARSVRTPATNHHPRRRWGPAARAVGGPCAPPHSQMARRGKPEGIRAEPPSRRSRWAGTGPSGRIVQPRRSAGHGRLVTRRRRQGRWYAVIRWRRRRR